MASDVDYANDPLIAAAMQVTNDAHNKVQQAEADLAAERLEHLSLRQEPSESTSTSTSPSRKRLSVISNTAGASPASPSRLPQRPPSVTSNASSAVSSRSGTQLSSTNKRASIVPRPTRASLLRQGGEAPPPPRGANSTASKRMSVGPGVTLSFKERQPIEVKSTKAPSIAPRMTKAAALRSGGQQAPSGMAFGSALNTSAPRHRRTDSEPATSSYTPASGVNREAVKATKAPKIAPRMTKAAQLRGAGGPPPSPSSSSSSSTLAPKRRPASMIVGSKSQPPAGFI